MVLSCRYIGNHQFISADVSMTCLDDEHLFYIKVVILPALLIYGLLIPITLIIYLAKN
jgi:hypothetical protein